MIYEELSENWNTAIGLQQVDGLDVSDHLILEAEKQTDGEKTIREVIRELKGTDYAAEDREMREADLVSARIVSVLEEDGFECSVEELLRINGRLFEGLQPAAGQIRTYDIMKKEWVLRGESVDYGAHREIRTSLERELKKERAFSYEGLSLSDITEHLTGFLSRIWKIHPFGEGNTRTISVFLLKYLRSMGIEIRRNEYAESSEFFRNALVRANYENEKKQVAPTELYLGQFMRNLLLGEENLLFNKDLVLSEASGRKKTFGFPVLKFRKKKFSFGKK